MDMCSGAIRFAVRNLNIRDHLPLHTQPRRNQQKRQHVRTFPRSKFETATGVAMVLGAAVASTDEQQALVFGADDAEVVATEDPYGSNDDAEVVATEGLYGSNE